MHNARLSTDQLSVDYNAFPCKQRWALKSAVL